jgi:sulfate adenylyltransferase
MQPAILLLTGLPAAGKTTLAQTLGEQLRRGGNRVAILDGDTVRAQSQRRLGYTRADRERQLERVGDLAIEAVGRGEIAVCALIAPYRVARDVLRQRASAVGRFYEVHLATTLEVCECRDTKGLYAAARAGKIARFTGISDPYETPQAPELRLDLGALSAEGAAQLIVVRLARDQVITLSATIPS